MELKEYLRLVPRSAAPLPTDDQKISMALIGIMGESGEFADMLKKHMFHGHNLDINALSKEIGDLMWYVAYLCHVLDINLETVLEGNIDKLRERYPDGFSHARSKSRIEYLPAD